MTRRLLLLLLLLLGPAAGWAQDLLTRQNGEEIKVNVLEITPTSISYRRFDNPDGPLITVRKADVFMIHYANGTKEVFGTTPPTWRQPAAAAYPPPRPAVPGAAPGSLPDPVPGDEVRPEEAVALNGPRIGITLLAGGVADKARDEYSINPFLTQFGWQFETRLFPPALRHGRVVRVRAADWRAGAGQVRAEPERADWHPGSQRFRVRGRAQRDAY